MTEPPVVTKIEVTEFSFEMVNSIPHEKTRIPIYKKGAKYSTRARVLRVFTDQGITGEYLGALERNTPAFRVSRTPSSAETPWREKPFTTLQNRL